MNRFFEVFDSQGSRKYSDYDLPLELSNRDSAHVFLFSDDREPLIAGYIGDSEGHLFFQPANTGCPVYHNNRFIQSSVWIKSGDSSRAGDNIIRFNLSGDRVELHVEDIRHLEGPVVLPTPPSTEYIEPDAISLNKKASTHSPKSHGFFYLLVACFFIFLSGLAIFLVAARTVEITTDPPDAELGLNGLLPVLRMKDTFLTARGEYTVTAGKNGYQPLETKIQVNGSLDDALHFTLKKLPGKVDIRTEPVSGVKIVIDGKTIAHTPAKELILEAGPHQLTLIKERYLTQQQTVEIDGLDKHQQYLFTLQPGWGELYLNTMPAGGVVSINDKPSGKTPVTLSLMAGHYDIVITRPGYTDHHIRLDLEAGEKVAIDPVKLIPAVATIALSSTPGNAIVTLDGTYQGRTPLTLYLEPNREHKLSLTTPGYKTLVKQVAYSAAANEKLHLRLPSEQGSVLITASPPETQLFINGKSAKKSSGLFLLPALKQTIEAKAKGYISQSRTIVPDKNYNQQLDFNLRKAETSASVSQHKKPVKKAHRKSPTAVSQADKAYTNTIGQTMLLLPPASFSMGSRSNDPGRRANEKERRVQLTRAFYLSATEVTNAQYREFSNTHDSGSYQGFSLNGALQPAVNVSWENAARYCNWLSKKEGLTPFYTFSKNNVSHNLSANGYRLPFEAEWSFAARTAKRPIQVKYPWTGNYPPTSKVANFADTSAYRILPSTLPNYHDGFPVSAAIKSFSANPAGLYDLGGNVSEWCHDYYTPGTGISSKLELNPLGPPTGTHHVVRDSSWRDASITELRFSYRNYSRKAGNDIGFRIARFQ